ncbi:cation efflux family-domain-containing protein [Limtongia smithiae]|uniref:cation efflux family-domain-containing protein n=1 Tax=Limtongia smithiae TaxID=1125753 RepID=UPI0034CDA1C0
MAEPHSHSHSLDLRALHGPEDTAIRLMPSPILQSSAKFGPSSLQNQHNHSHSEHSNGTTANAATGPEKLVKLLRQPVVMVQTMLSHPDTRSIFLFLLLNFSFMFIQFVYSLLSHSLGLLSDSIHMLLDCLALLVGLLASVMAKWPPSASFPYGLSKIESLSGFVNGVMLIGISIGIVIEAIERIWTPVEIERTTELLVVSSLGLVVNLVGIVAFNHGHGGGHGHSHSHSHGGHVAHEETKGEPENHSHSHESAHNHTGHDHSVHDHSGNDHSDHEGHSADNDNPFTSPTQLAPQAPVQRAPMKRHKSLISSLPFSCTEGDDEDNCTFDHKPHDGEHDSDHADDDNGKGGHKHNENMHGLFLHILADTLGSVGVIVSTLLTSYFGWSGFDPLASLFIAVLIFFSAIPLVTSSATTLLLSLTSEQEYVLRNALNDVMSVPGVVGYSNPRFWATGGDAKSGAIRGVIHVQILDEADPVTVREKVNARICGALKGVSDLFIQVERYSVLASSANNSPAKKY